MLSITAKNQKHTEAWDQESRNDTDGSTRWADGGYSFSADSERKESQGLLNQYYESYCEAPDQVAKVICLNRLTADGLWELAYILIQNACFAAVKCLEKWSQTKGLTTASVKSKLSKTLTASTEELRECLKKKGAKSWLAEKRFMTKELTQIMYQEFIKMIKDGSPVDRAFHLYCVRIGIHISIITQKDYDKKLLKDGKKAWMSFAEVCKLFGSPIESRLKELSEMISGLHKSKIFDFMDPCQVVEDPKYHVPTTPARNSRKVISTEVRMLKSTGSCCWSPQEELFSIEKGFMSLSLFGGSSIHFSPYEDADASGMSEAIMTAREASMLGKVLRMIGIDPDTCRSEPFHPAPDLDTQTPK